MDARLCAQQECCDQRAYVLPEPNDNLTNLKAVESTASKPETPERCGLSHMIEPSVSRSLGIVALALELNESDFVAVLCRSSSGRSNLAEQPDRPTRLSGHCAAHSARVPMTGAVVVQCCAVLAGDGLAPAGRANGVLASVLAALLCCTVVCITYVNVFMR